MNDDEIIALYRDRQETAILESNRKYGRYCYRIAKNITGSHEDAEELVSDTWMKAWNSIPSHFPASLRAFFGKITRNLALNRYRAIRRAGEAVSEVLQELEECVSGEETVEDAVRYRELVRQIGLFLNELTPLDRELFCRRYFETESLRSIAGQLRLSENNASVRLSRIRKKLRAYLEEREMI